MSVRLLAGFLAPCQRNNCYYYYSVGKVENFANGKGKVKLKKHQNCNHYVNNIKSKSKKYLIRNEFAAKPAATFSARVSTDIPLHETPGALFDDYLEHTPRILNAMFPDNHGSQQLNQNEWRIQMLPLKLLALNVCPVIHLRLRCKSGGRDYPPDVPHQISKLLEFDITRWELQGLDNVVDPSHFTLAMNGALYPDRTGNKSRIRGHSETIISIVFPPALALIPDNIRNSLVNGVIKNLAEGMKRRVDGSLIADYSKFKTERSDEVRIFTKL